MEATIALDLLGLVAVAVLVLANAFFVAAEFSLVSVRRTRIAELVENGDTSANAVQEAIEHINHYGTHHSDAIVTNDKASAGRFLNEVDSACVYLNASTRFTDGYEFGMGAEIGISTDKLHARGPMALEELTTYKYTVYGSGQIRT